MGVQLYQKLRKAPNKEDKDMTVQQINEILQGTFTDEADRQYWENKKAELIRKEANAQSNKEYYRNNAVYNR